MLLNINNFPYKITLYVNFSKFQNTPPFIHIGRESGKLTAPIALCLVTTLAQHVNIKTASIHITISGFLVKIG